MLKSFDELVPAIRRRFERTWADVTCGDGRGGASGTGGAGSAWPHAFALGRPTRTQLERNAGLLVDEIDALRTACKRYGCLLETEPRRLGAMQELPVRVVVPSADVAAGILGAAERERLARGRTRAEQIVSAFPQVPTEDLRGVVRRIDMWDDVDVELLLAAAKWFADNDAQGLTPRQVPLDGFHAKWLDAAGRRSLVCLLAGKSDLGLQGRPRELALSYLDPTWLGGGGRRYDVCVEGDTWRPPYDPHVVLVVENKDSYLLFPQVEGGVCVFGSGKSGPAVCSQHDWIAKTPRLFYWGDMDADGLEILDAYRAAGLAVDSILMDVEAFDRYERFGTRMAAGKRSLRQHARIETPWLEPGEQRLYDRLCDNAWQGALRIEQERIPLDAALAELERKIAAAK